MSKKTPVIVLWLALLSGFALGGEPEHGTTRNTVSTRSRVAVGTYARTLNPKWTYLEIDTRLLPADVARGVKMTWSDVYAREKNTRWIPDKKASGDARQLWKGVPPGTAAGRRVHVDVGGGFSIPGGIAGPGPSVPGKRVPDWYSLAVDVDIDVDSNRDGRIATDNSSSAAVTEDAIEDDKKKNPVGALAVVGRTVPIIIRPLMEIRSPEAKPLSEMVEGWIAIRRSAGRGKVLLQYKESGSLKNALDKKGRLVSTLWKKLLKGEKTDLEMKGVAIGSLELEAELSLRPKGSSAQHTKFKDKIRVTVLDIKFLLSKPKVWLTDWPEVKKTKQVRSPKRVFGKKDGGIKVVVWGWPSKLVSQASVEFRTPSLPAGTAGPKIAMRVLGPGPKLRNVLITKEPVYLGETFSAGRKRLPVKDEELLSAHFVCRTVKQDVMVDRLEYAGAIGAVWEATHLWKDRLTTCKKSLEKKGAWTNGHITDLSATETFFENAGQAKDNEADVLVYIGHGRTGAIEPTNPDGAKPDNWFSPFDVQKLWTHDVDWFISGSCSLFGISLEKLVIGDKEKSPYGIAWSKWEEPKDGSGFERGSPSRFFFLGSRPLHGICGYYGGVKPENPIAEVGKYLAKGHTFMLSWRAANAKHGKLNWGVLCKPEHLWDTLKLHRPDRQTHDLYWIRKDARPQSFVPWFKKKNASAERKARKPKIILAVSLKHKPTSLPELRLGPIKLPRNKPDNFSAEPLVDGVWWMAEPEQPVKEKSLEDLVRENSTGKREQGCEKKKEEKEDRHENPEIEKKTWGQLRKEIERRHGIPKAMKACPVSHIRATSLVSSKDKDTSQETFLGVDFHYRLKHKGVPIIAGAYGYEIVVVCQQGKCVAVRWRYRPILGEVGPARKLVRPKLLWPKVKGRLGKARFSEKTIRVTGVACCYVDIGLLEGRKDKGKRLRPCWRFVVEGAESIYVDGFTGKVLKPKEPLVEPDSKTGRTKSGK